MKSTAAIAAIAGLTVYSQNFATNLFGKDPIEKEYLDFINEHGKSYGTREEYELRLNIFRKNLKLIQEHNSNNHDDHTLAVNHMADWTEAEIQRINGLRRKQRNAKAIQNEKINLEDLPASVNWVEAGAVTPIKDQGALCASDWAFSATGAIEGAYQIKNGELVSFSEQQILDCSDDYGNDGCDGGQMDFAFKYAEDKALDTEAQYPYSGFGDGCNVPKEGVQKVVSFTEVTPKSPAALAAAVAQGPVSVGIDTKGFGFLFYKKGIIKRFCGIFPDHAALVVGYGSEDGTDYWLLKNSWGTKWGEKGYFRIMKEMDKDYEGLCGIQEMPSYPSF